MGWLKVLAQGVLQGAKFVIGLRNTGVDIPVKAGVIDEIENVIKDVEIVGAVIDAHGDQKLAMAAPLVEQVLLRSESWSHFKIADERKDLFRAGCAKIASGMADVLNSREH